MRRISPQDESRSSRLGREEEEVVDSRSPPDEADVDAVGDGGRWSVLPRLTSPGAFPSAAAAAEGAKWPLMMVRTAPWSRLGRRAVSPDADMRAIEPVSSSSRSCGRY